MPREIRFRAWSLIAKRMLSHEFLVGATISPTFPDGEAFIFEQFTGLKDSKGVDVYEGDIVQQRHNGKVWVGKMGFVNGCFAVRYRDEDLEDTFVDEAKNYIPIYGTLKDFEVIGDIHRNPDLLRVRGGGRE